jgi:hypothetical protein
MEAVISGYGLVGKPSSFAVKITDKFGNTHERTVPLKVKSRYQAELAAIKYVCLAIPHKDVELTIKTSVTQVPQIFKKDSGGEFLKRSKPNELVDNLRELSTQFSSFQCLIDKDSEDMLSVKQKAKLPSSI